MQNRSAAVSYDLDPAPPTDADVAGALGRAERALAAGRVLDAIAECEALIRAGADRPDVRARLADALRVNGEVERAVREYRLAIERDPENAALHLELGNTLHDAGALDDAAAVLERAVELDPGSAPAMLGLLRTSRYRGDAARADELVERIAAIAHEAPAEAAGLVYLGLAYTQVERNDDALRALRRACELQPRNPFIINLVGILLEEEGRTAEAVRYFERAISLSPDDAEVRFNLATALLRLGDLRRGFAEYESRWRSRHFPSPRRTFAQPMWRGEKLDGRTVLLHTEQGLGDSLQFIRYAPLVARNGGTVVVECEPALERLLAGCEGVSRVVRKGEGFADFDVHCPLLSLPHLFGTTVESVPAEVPYLRPRGLLPPLPARAGCRRLRVGIAWEGSRTGANFRNKSCPVSLFEPLFGDDRVEVYSLQKGEGVAELNAHPMRARVHELGSGFADLNETALAMGQLDLVVTVDTSIAHLAGALALPTWLLLSADNDWRWLIDRDDSPWYPTMRVFRQPAPRDWDSVAAAVAREIGPLADRHATTIQGDTVHASVSPAATPDPAPARAAEQLVDEGFRHQLAGRLDQAEESYRNALLLDPRCVRALGNLGMVASMRGDDEAALDAFRRALELDPDNVDNNNNLGVVHLGRREFALAARHFHRAALGAPGVPDPVRNFAVALREGGNPAGGEELLREALETNPDSPLLLGGLASCVYQQGRLDEAEPIARRAFERDPANVDALLVLATCAMERLELDAAVEYFDRVIASKPTESTGTWNRGFARLLQGDYANGWEDYEKRWGLTIAARQDVVQHASLPQWDGSSLDGRTILLHVEQGLGDAIQFVRYAPLLKERWEVDVVVECYPSLVSLFRTSPGVDQVVARGDALPPVDLQASMMSLPRLLGTTVDTIPAAVPYFTPEPTDLSRRVRAAQGLKVGIVWAGNPDFRRDARRSLHASMVAHLAAIPGLQLFSLQVGALAPQLADSPYADRVIDVGSEVRAGGGDLAATAAVIDELDLVVTTCTSVAHLAGALGKETWVMLPYLPDWRWLLEREDSPWYPSARLFRQPRLDDWSTVIHRVGAELRERARALQPEPARHDPAPPAVAGPIEPELGAFLAEQLEPGDVLVDIGSDDGAAALAAASLPGRPLRAAAIVYDADAAERVLAHAAALATPGRVEVAVARPDRLPLDEIAARAYRLTGGRVFVRVARPDEASDVLAACAGLLEEGRLAGFVWSARPGHAPDEIVGRGLEAFGFTRLRVRHTDAGTELTSFDDPGTTGPVFALSATYLAALVGDPEPSAAPAVEPRGSSPATPPPLEPAPIAATRVPAAAERPKLVIDWQPGTQSGWGVYGLNLTLHALRSGRADPLLLVAPDLTGISPLQRRVLAPALDTHRQLADFSKRHAGRPLEIGHPVLHALGNGLGPALNGALRGKREIGVVFFEDTALDEAAIERGRAFDRIVAGSSWNGEVLRAYGLTDVAVCLQGVDPTVFHPGPRSGWLGDRFVVFSGGKLEYRKGQDIVVAAFREFHRRHPDALLMVAWHNHWPLSMAEVPTRGHVQGIPDVNAGRLDVGGWLVRNGIPADAFVDLGLATNFQMGQLVREADVALFPNRGEGGTNLVAMECLASGVPTILSANTGHLDLVDPDACFPLADQGPVTPTPSFRGVDGWGESSVDEILEALEAVYTDTDEARRRARNGAERMRGLSWANQIDQLLATIADLF